MYVTNFLLYRFVILVNTYCHIMAQTIKDLCLIYIMVNVQVARVYLRFRLTFLAQRYHFRWSFLVNSTYKQLLFHGSLP